MSTTHYRHPVGKATVSGYLPVKPRDEVFFAPDPGAEGREIEIVFGEEKAIRARLQRSGKENQLKVSFTGKAGAPFRSWLRKTFRPLAPRRPRGVLVLAALGPDRFSARAEKIRQAMVDELELGGRHYFEGARPISILHPALSDLESVIQRVTLPPPAPVAFVRERIERELREAGWAAVGSVGGGLLLPAGLRRSGAELHLVLEVADLYTSLLSLAAGSQLHQIELGVLLVADAALGGRLRQGSSAPPASLERVLREIEALPFLIRGPLCVIALSMRRKLR